MKKYLIISCLILLIGLASCDQRYRYPCQDPEKLKDPECQKDKCEISRECPKFIKGQ